MREQPSLRPKERPAVRLSVGDGDGTEGVVFRPAIGAPLGGMKPRGHRASESAHARAQRAARGHNFKDERLAAHRKHGRRRRSARGDGLQHGGFGLRCGAALHDGLAPIRKIDVRNLREAAAR